MGEAINEPWIALVCPLCGLVLEDITVAAALPTRNTVPANFTDSGVETTPLVYDGSGNWQKYQGEERCVCGEYKCYLVIVASKNIAGYVTIKACLYCDLQPQDIDTPDWDWKQIPKPHYDECIFDFTGKCQRFGCNEERAA